MTASTCSSKVLLPKGVSPVTILFKRPRVCPTRITINRASQRKQRLYLIFSISGLTDIKKIKSNLPWRKNTTDHLWRVHPFKAPSWARSGLSLPICPTTWSILTIALTTWATVPTNYRSSLNSNPLRARVNLISLNHKKHWEIIPQWFQGASRKYWPTRRSMKCKSNSWYATSLKTSEYHKKKTAI